MTDEAIELFEKLLKASRAYDSRTVAFAATALLADAVVTGFLGTDEMVIEGLRKTLEIRRAALKKGR